MEYLNKTEKVLLQNIQQKEDIDKTKQEDIDQQKTTNSMF